MEAPLAGGHVNHVVRVGDTVRRPQGPWSKGVHALLEWFERVGFDGAPRFLGIDEKNREVLSYVEGNPGLPPLPPEDDVLIALASLLRRMHDAQAGFTLPDGCVWLHANTSGPLLCHQDLFPPNVIFREGTPVALIDWDLAAPGDRLDDVAVTAYHWAPLRTPEWSTEQGLPPQRFGERTRLLCDAYGLTRTERAELIDRVLGHRIRGYALHEQLGGRERRPGWREMWDAGSGARIRANASWIVDHREHIAKFLA